MKERIKALFYLHHAGDIIGFKNGKWIYNVNLEMKKPDLYIMLEMIYDFINSGGITQIDISNMKCHVPTYLHFAMLATILKFSGSYNTREFRKFMTHIMKAINFGFGIENETDSILKKGMNIYLYDTFKLFFEKRNANREDLQHIVHNLGYECSVMNLPVGLVYSNNELIDFCMNMNMLFTSSPISYLSGLTSALFVSYAVKDINIDDWTTKLMKILNSELVVKHMDFSNEKIFEEYFEYILYWEKYIEYRKNNITDFYNRLINLYDILENKKYDNYFGSLGYASIIIAYDSLYLARDNIEKLIYYSTMYNGYTFASGSIAMGLYGAMYGFKNVPQNLQNIPEYYKGKYNFIEKLFVQHLLHEDVITTTSKNLFHDESFFLYK